MKLTNKLETEILKSYNAYWNSYLKGDMKTFAKLLDDNCHIIGSTEFDVFRNKKSAVKFYTSTADQISGKADFRNRKITLLPSGENVMVEEFCDFYFLANDEWKFYGHCRLSTLFSEKEGGWKIIYQHGSMPDSKAEEGDQIAAKEVAEENKKLRNAIKRRTVELETKNRELEIETALERVRTVAMAMRTADDLLEICKIVYSELLFLGFNELRNVMINIHYDDKASLLNYDYSDNFGKTITDIPYNFHALVEKQVAVTKNAQDAFFEFSFEGDELKQFRELRKSNGEQDDPKLEITDALYYYFFSIGTGSIGISTYNVIQEEKLELLKRFRNVFNLSYQRYTDISKAEAQARESQIQLALERVRARTMAMQKSEELSDAVYVLFQQFKELGENPDQATIGVVNEDEKVIEYWVTMHGNPINKVFKFPIDEPNVTNKIYNAWKENKKSLVINLSGRSLTDFMAYRAGKGGAAINPKEKRRIINVAFFSKGLLNVQSNEERSVESIRLLERFASVFEQTYTRFLDLQKAEAQSRESQIQLALERVRARTMAMRKSDELLDAATLLFQQIELLRASSWNCSFNIWDEDKKHATAWNGIKDGFGRPFKSNSSENVFLDFYKGGQKGEKLFVKEIGGTALKNHYKYLSAVPGVSETLAELKAAGVALPTFQIFHIAYFAQGYLMFITYESVPEFHEIFKRFANVFEQTYTRFLDLQKAEAQAREAEIELALERVRARTMAMQHSDELADASLLLDQQIRGLGIKTRGCAFNIYGEKESTEWFSNEMGTMQTYKTPREKVFLRYYEAGQKGETLLIKEFSGKECVDWYNYLCTLPVIGDGLKEMIANGGSFPTRQIDHVSFFKYGYLLFLTFEPVPEFHEIFKRFAKVFEQTYTRFLDLQKAEAQAREAQIEAALEKVRSRSMGMQKSEELKEVIRVVYEQFVHLNINVEHAGFIMDYKERDDMHIWLADQHEVPSELFIPYFNSAHWNSFKEAKEKENNFFANYLNYEEKNKFYKSLFKLFPVPDEAKEYYFNCPALAISTVLLENVSLYIENFQGIPYTDEENKILMRFGKVFQQTYTRFLDLQKVEAQAREAKIEAAIEKVRSRSLAMYKSEELQDVVDSVFARLKELRIQTDAVNILTVFNDLNYYDIWAGTEDGYSTKFKIPIKSEKDMSDKELISYNAVNSGEGLLIETYSFEEKNEYWNYLFSETDLKYAPEQRKKFILEAKAFIRSGAISKNTSLLASRYSDKLFTDQENDIFIRFGKVFEQAYTRFLDLQKAEAQAREATIEAALEKVRSRSLAMHKTDELQEVVTVVLEKMTDLNIELDTININIYKEDSKELNLWTAAPGQKYAVPFHLPFFDHPFHTDIFTPKESGLDFFTKTYSFEEKNNYFNYTFEHSDFKYVPEDKKKLILDGRACTRSIAMTKNAGIIMIRYSDKPFSENENEILKRFAKVFEQAYVRFLDLQKAEAQAREAQIETALEKVRSRSMGMQKSEELKEVIKVVYEQFVHLNINVEHTGFIMDYKERDDMHIWLADQHLVPSEVFIPYFDSAHWNSFIEAKEKGTDFFATLLDFEEKNKFYKDLFALIPGIPQETIDYYFSCPGLAGSTVLLDNVSLYIENFQGTPYTDEENKILMRFGKVFQQTYTRFLDLQNAEAQAREAQIEVALEKVRSRTMAMFKSEELADAAATVFHQLQTLGIRNLHRSLVGIMNEEEAVWDVWYTTVQGESFAKFLKMPVDGHPIASEMKMQWLRKEKIQVSLSGDNLKSWLKFIMHSGWQYPEGERPPDKFIIYGLPFSNGYLVAFTDEEITPAEIDLLQRFARVFDQTYTRFLDLQKAEAQAREAQIEAALEKVRSIAMSMMKSNELLSICEAVFKQLQLLGFADVRAAQIYIRNDAEEKFLNYDYSDISGADVVEVNYNSHPHTRRIYDVIKNAGDVLIDNVVTTDQLEEWKSYLYDTLKQPPEKSLDTATELHYYLYSIGTGAFGICTFRTMNADELQILKRFRNVFNLSYQRYYDMTLAEAQAREAKIETALERVRSRTLAMQKSDELAETSAVLFKQLIGLGIAPNRLYIGVINDESGNIEFWITDEDGSKVSTMFSSNTNNNASIKKMYNGWKQQNKSVVIDMHGKELDDYFHYLGEELRVPFKDGLSQKRRIQYISYFSKGFIGMASPDEQPPETVNLLNRFASVFNLTFTRFNDLTVAEAHALQAEQDLIEIKSARQKAEEALKELQATQKQLIQSEKMASLGELTAGIAHEIQNPLNFVNNFSEVSNELINEMNEELEKGDIEEAKAIAADVKQNLEKINHHGNRAADIVKGMLQHSRSSTGVKEPTDINALADEYLRLSYHGLRAKDKDFNATMKTDFDNSIGKINIIPQDIGRVLLNLFNNAFYEVNEQKSKNLISYEPTVTVKTFLNPPLEGREAVIITVSDNGNGIPQKIVDKIFQPFFTTKPTGQGTGLGLSLSYDIIKAHSGEIKMESKVGEGSSFIIQLPIA